MANINKPFEPYYDRVLGSTITSQRQKERLMKSHRSKSHPMGIYDIRDDHKHMKEMADIARHREEYKAANRPGYKPMTEREIAKYGERKMDSRDPRNGTKYFHR